MCFVVLLFFCFMSFPSYSQNLNKCQPTVAFSSKELSFFIYARRYLFRAHSVMLEIASTPIGAKHRWLLVSLLFIFGASITFDHTSGDSIFIDVFVLSGTFWIGTLIVSTYVPQIPIIRGSILAIRERHEQTTIINNSEPADADADLPLRISEDIIDENSLIHKTHTTANISPSGDEQYTAQSCTNVWSEQYTAQSCTSEPGLTWDMLKQLWKYEEAEQRRAEVKEKNDVHDTCMKDDSSSSVAPTTQSSSTHAADNRIIDVWAHNFQEEMEHLRKKVATLRYVAFDTEYPGFVKECTSTKATHEERNYDTLRKNIDVIKLIQLGLSCTDAEGSDDDECCCWQFHFEFDRDFDEQNESSMQLLTNANIDWGRLKREGINHQTFAKAFTQVFIENEAWENEKGLIRYISFHGMCDFAFLVKFATQWPLPDSLEDFFQLLDTYFPLRCDLKFILNFSGSLTHLASVYNVPRIGTAHQAGSDSLVTSAIFVALPEDIGEKGFMRGALFGLHAPFYLPPERWMNEDVAAALQDLAEDSSDIVSSMAERMVEEMDAIELEPPKEMPMVQLPVEKTENCNHLPPPLPPLAPDTSNLDPKAPSFEPGKLCGVTPPFFREDHAHPHGLPYDMSHPVDVPPEPRIQHDAPKSDSHLNANAAPYIPPTGRTTTNMPYGGLPMSDTLSSSHLPPRPYKQVCATRRASESAFKDIGVLPPMKGTSSLSHKVHPGALCFRVAHPIKHGSPVSSPVQPCARRLGTFAPTERTSPLNPLVQPDDNHHDAPLLTKRASLSSHVVQRDVNHCDAQLLIERASPMYPSVPPGVNHCNASLQAERASPLFSTVQRSDNPRDAPVQAERASPLFPSLQSGTNHCDAPLLTERASAQLGDNHRDALFRVERGSSACALQPGATHLSVARSPERISRAYPSMQSGATKHHDASLQYMPSDTEDTTSDSSPFAWQKNYIPQKVVSREEELGRVVRGWRNPRMKTEYAAKNGLPQGEEELSGHESDPPRWMGHERDGEAIRALLCERMGECADNHSTLYAPRRPFVTDASTDRLVPCIDNQHVFVVRGEPRDDIQASIKVQSRNHH